MANNDLPGTDTSGNAIARGIHKAGSTLHSTIDRVADPAGEAVERLSHGAHARVDKLETQASSAAEKLGEKADAAMAVPNRALEATRQCIQDRPFESVAAAAAIGLFVGWLWALSSRSRY
jgi:ElaB/YqjD/DUF883 family membrane-anchored ribosome-binding protein